MPPERAAAGSADDWLRRARSNLARARQSKPDEVAVGMAEIVVAWAETGATAK